MFGFYRVATATPRLRIADVKFNLLEISHQIKDADAQGCAVVLFPELAITGYSCGDLFHNSTLLDKSNDAIVELTKFSEDFKIIIIIGAPILHNGSLYNCAVAIQSGLILGVVPKSYLPNYREFYEKRWFTEGINISNSIDLSNQDVPFGDKLIFECDKYFKFGIEICEDLWNVIPPSSYHAIAGATVIFNPSASNELVSKANYRKSLVAGQSAKCIAGYVYSSAGVDESTTDVVYGGDQIIAENGAIIAKNERFSQTSSMMIAEIDCERLYYTRISESSFNSNVTDENYRLIKIDKSINMIDKITNKIDPSPFVPSNLNKRDEHCKEIFNIQTNGLAKRLKHTNLQKVVIGISGGLDSTLALLVIVDTFKLLKLPMKNLITITMPGFGTTDRTYNNAVELCQILKTDFREISIKDSSLRHFEDIGHDKEVLDVTYENVQARERTQLLMNIANKEGGIVAGTGDLSEIALGWSTYNADHMSMYGINCGVPKTLIRFLIQWVADKTELSDLKTLLKDIIDTPVSPELLPMNDAGEIEQKTEDILGPYELHDFFLYHTIKYGASPEKVLYLAIMAFDGLYNKKTISKTLDIFIKRFFANQFKRNCIPDGPKVGTIALSPRGDWRMPSDASSALWASCTI